MLQANKKLQKSLSLLVLFSVLTVFTGLGKEERNNFSDTPEGIRLYKQFCASCHGINMKGGIAPSLLLEKLKFGNSKEAIVKIIKEGVPATSMIAYGQTLGTEKVDAIARYIVEAREK